MIGTQQPDTILSTTPFLSILSSYMGLILSMVSRTCPFLIEFKGNLIHSEADKGLKVTHVIPHILLYEWSVTFNPTYSPFKLK